MKECQVCKQCYPDAVANCPEDGQPTFQSIAGDPIFEGKYRLEKRLGQGGMGVVYQARHSFLKTAHAIKVILPDLVGNDPQLVTRFRQEALAAAAIRHHNVVQVTDYGVAMDTMPFLVMEFVEGESLQDLLNREGRLSPEKAVDLMAAISAGVGAAHRQGIVHRDLKPLNVMIVKNSASMAEGVKILDFGLAKIKSGELLGSFVQAQTTGLMGSPYYMAPEQWADEDPDAQADVYSLGVMFYQMLGGDVPFKGSSIPAIMKKHLYDPPPSFSTIGVNVPPMVEAAVFHALLKDRHKRTQSVQEFVNELKRSLGQNTGPIGGTANLPVQASSSVHILTAPPGSGIYIDNAKIGESQPDGWLLIEGLQSGMHRLRVSAPGFRDWENQIVCDGKAQQIVAKLEPSANTGYPEVAATQVMPVVNPTDLQGLNTGYQNTGNASQVGFQPGTQPNMQPNQQPNMQPSGQNWQSGQQFVQTQTQQKKSSLPMILGVTGIFGLLLLLGIGTGVAYKAGLFGGNVVVGPSSTPTVTPSPEPSAVAVKAELVSIPGGTFMMGSKDGPLDQQPAHQVEVKPFKMDRTEVTNAEYYNFTKEMNYKTPSNWVNGHPVPEEESFPVVRVNIESVDAFIEWRSQRDGVKYRLPTEEEWEYAARNGGKNNIFPWGDQWAEGKAVIETTIKPVGSKAAGKNEWGVEDLIGNVWEWTSSPIKAYPGSKSEIQHSPSNAELIIRGGSYKSGLKDNLTSLTRKWIEPTREDGLLGFRLVSSQ